MTHIPFPDLNYRHFVRQILRHEIQDAQIFTDLLFSQPDNVPLVMHADLVKRLAFPILQPIFHLGQPVFKLQL